MEKDVKMDKINVLQLQLNSGYGCGVSTYVKNIVSCSPNCRYFVSLNESLTDDIVQEKLQPIYKQVEKFIRLNDKYSICEIFRRLSELRKNITTFKIQLVHAHTLRAGLLGALVKVFLPSLKLVYTGHGLRYRQKETSLEKFIFFLLEALVCFQADRIIHIRKSDFQTFLQAPLPNKAKGKLLNNRIDDIFLNDRMLKPQEKFAVGCIGNLLDIKNPALFIKIAELLLKKQPQAKFYWVGGGEKLDFYRQKVADNDNIEFLGVLEGEAKAEFLASLDVFLLVSELETFPTVVLEAYSSATLVLANAYVGVEDILEDEVTGLTFIYNEEQAAVDKLEWIMANTSVCEIIRQNGRAHFLKNYSKPQILAQEHEELYQELLKR